MDALKFQTLVVCKKALANSADADQTASEEAVWSGSSLFAILKSILWISALITNILLRKEDKNFFEILEHLPYTKGYPSISYKIRTVYRKNQT